MLTTKTTKDPKVTNSFGQRCFGPFVIVVCFVAKTGQ